MISGYFPDYVQWFPVQNHVNSVLPVGLQIIDLIDDILYCRWLDFWINFFLPIFTAERLVLFFHYHATDLLIITNLISCNICSLEACFRKEVYQTLRCPKIPDLRNVRLLCLITPPPKEKQLFLCSKIANFIFCETKTPPSHTITTLLFKIITK